MLPPLPPSEAAVPTQGVPIPVANATAAASALHNGDAAPSNAAEDVDCATTMLSDADIAVHGEIEPADASLDCAAAHSSGNASSAGPMSPSNAGAAQSAPLPDGNATAAASAPQHADAIPNNAGGGARGGSTSAARGTELNSSESKDSSPALLADFHTAIHTAQADLEEIASRLGPKHGVVHSLVESARAALRVVGDADRLLLRVQVLEASSAQLRSLLDFTMAAVMAA